MHFHRWETVERIGRVVTERCTRCPKIRTRVRGAVAVPPVIPSSGHPDRRPVASTARTAAPVPHSAPAAHHRNEDR